MSKLLSTGDVARLHGVQIWQVRRLFEDGTLPEPGRFAGKRAIPLERISEITEAMRARGWLEPAEAVK